jgi:lipoyl(octanoyl) transferase
MPTPPVQAIETRGERSLTLAVRDLGRLAYAPAMQVQVQVHQAVLDGDQPPTLLLVEHDPVITVSQRKGSAEHLLASPQQLAQLGIDVQPTNRGGDITYHGPGQLVAYPILPLAPLGLNVGRYMRLLELAVIDTLAAFGIDGIQQPGLTGVWTPAPGSAPRSIAGRDGPPNPPAKICALGVRVRRNVAMHGLALNVRVDLTHFATIVPCGLAGRRVTSMHEHLGERTPTMDAVKRQLTASLHNRLAGV